MPLNLLLDNAGDYERTHQILLYVLFKEGRLAEHLGLPASKEVGWEDEKRLFDLTLKGADGVTGIEVKTWATVSDDQASRQRTWSRKDRRRLVYILLGFAEFEGVRGDEVPGEHHIGARALRDAAVELTKDDRSGASVRGLAEAYARWLERHLQERLHSLHADKAKWGRLHYSVAYDLLRSAVGLPADIYYVANPAGGVQILNFSEAWHDLEVGDLRGTKLYWELIDGWPYFKIGPVPEGRDARAVRAELREILLATAKSEGLPLVQTGRTGEYMSLAYADRSATDFFSGAKLDAKKARNYLLTCHKVHERTATAWRKR